MFIIIKISLVALLLSCTPLKGLEDDYNYYSTEPVYYPVISSRICIQAYTVTGWQVLGETVLGEC